MSVDYDRTIPAASHGGRFSTDPPPFDVVHSTEGPMSDGNAVALAQWFARSKANGGPGTSATGIFDPVASVRMLDEHTVPYHVGPDGNPISTGDEHCGSVNLTPAQWMSARGQAMLDASAKVKAQRAIARGWSLADCRWLSLTEVARRTVRGFCTHNDVRLALGGTTHSDPGPNFPYAWYMGRIRYWFQVLTGTQPLEDDDVSYKDWPAADRQLLLDDISRQITRGQKIDGTKPPQLVDASTGKIVELVNLLRVGDDPDPATGDTHPGLDTVLREVNSLAGVVASQGETLAAIAAAVVPAEQPTEPGV